jgi:lysyl endopeptidase
LDASPLRRILAAAAIAVPLAVGAPLLVSAAYAQSNAEAMAPFAAKAAAREAFRLPPGAPATLLRLGALPARAIAAVRDTNSRAFTKRVQIGIGRPLTDPATRSASLQWLQVAGGVAARWEVSALGAAALRIALEVGRMPQGAELRFAGSGDPDTVYGPFGSVDVLQGGALYWSPVLEGEQARIEVFIPDGVARDAARLRIATVSHLFTSPRDGDAEGLAKSGSDVCEVDFVCRSATDPALANAGRSVARMTFSDGAGGATFLCTGTLLNPADGSFKPYFYSANHCIGSAASAATVTTHWFYDRSGCGTGSTNPAYVQLTGGAALVYNDAASDALLLRLNKPPPAGAVFAGWDASPLATGTALTAIHHPEGDWKKVSLASSGGFATPALGPTGSFIVADWNSTATGVTEPGSSGSGLFTAVGQPAREYRLRGALYGGPSSCDALPASLHDYYSRFDLVYPAIARFLNPANVPGPTAASANYTALWWNPAEAGWGLNVNQQGDIVFATLFTYDETGQPLWLVMSDGARQGSADIFSGTLLSATGPAFDAPHAPASLAAVGTMTLTFMSAEAATLTYSVNGVSVTKAIQRQVFGSRAALCLPATGARTALTNHQDLWWNAAEPGWGLNVTQQGDVIFATLFTYDATGHGLWLVMSGGARQPDGSFLGDLYRATGSAFDAQPFIANTAANLAKVGTLRLAFSDGTRGTLDYSVDGIAISKAITRQVFSSPVPACVS